MVTWQAAKSVKYEGRGDGGRNNQSILAVGLRVGQLLEGVPSIIRHKLNLNSGAGLSRNAGEPTVVLDNLILNIR